VKATVFIVFTKQIKYEHLVLPALFQRMLHLNRYFFRQVAVFTAILLLHSCQWSR